MSVGVERIGVYGGRAFLDVKRLAAARGLDGVRFDNLLMRRKTVSLHFEDPVSFAVNAGERALAGLSASDGSYGNGANPTHIYPAISTYTAVVTATNTNNS